MRRLAAMAAFCLLALGASAQSFFGRALLEFQRVDYGTMPREGFRQQYDVRWDRTISDTSRLRVLFRADDFDGTTDSALQRVDTKSRQLQPIAELVLNAAAFHVQARTEVIDTESSFGDRESHRRLGRSSGNFVWAPERLPILTLVGQRNVTTERAARVDLTEDLAYASLEHQWHGVMARVENRYSREEDPQVGYSRKTNARIANLNYAASYFNGRLMVGADASTQKMNIDERSVNGQSSSIPTPVTVSRGLWAVDDTPNDNRDHPLSPVPALNDGNQGTSSGILLGPEGVSFQNIAVDLGRVDRLDEIQVVVRDGSGSPLRNGGGPIAWDLYTSDDGMQWTPLASQSRFDAPLSLYSVTFDLTSARWFKVVNFGVNAETTVVTEVLAWYHTDIAAGQVREGTLDLYTGNATISVQPIKRLSITYTGLYSQQQQDLSTAPYIETSDFENFVSFQYDVLRSRGLTLRGQYLKRDVTTYTGQEDDSTAMTLYVDAKPLPKLLATLELGRQDQMLDGDAYTIDTRALHLSGQMLRSASVTLDVGNQKQTVPGDEAIADRDYLNVTGMLRLLPSLRMLLTGTMQKTAADSDSDATQVLGPARDNRIAGDFLYRPGRPLFLSVRLGYVSGEVLSGFTQRYHVEWYPFGDGTVSIGGSYNQDIDPLTNRRSERFIFNPRWTMNRWATLDLNYTQFTTSLRDDSRENKSFYATLILTR